MTDTLQDQGWWQASDGRWYPPETHPGYLAPPAVHLPPPVLLSAPPTVPGSTSKKAWWKRWWGIALLAFVALVVAANIGASTTDDDTEGAGREPAAPAAPSAPTAPVPGEDEVPFTSTGDFARWIRSHPTVKTVQELMDETVAQTREEDFDTAAEFATQAASHLQILADAARLRSDGSEAADATVVAFESCATGFQVGAETLVAVAPSRSEFEAAVDDCTDALAMSSALLNDAERTDPG